MIFPQISQKIKKTYFSKKLGILAQNKKSSLGEGACRKAMEVEWHGDDGCDVYHEMGSCGSSAMAEAGVRGHGWSFGPCNCRVAP